MLGAIIGILKVIGILLLCILGLILLILLSVLFVPIRYKMDAAKKEEYHVYARVCWFLHFIQAEIFWSGGQPEIEIRLLGLQLSQYKKIFGKLKRIKRIKKNKPVKTEDDDLQQVQIQSIEEKPVEVSREAEPIEPEPIEPVKVLEEPKVSKIYQWKQKVFTIIRSIPQKIIGIKNKIAGMFRKIKSALKKASAWKEYLKSQEFRDALAAVKRELFWLFNKIKPKKLKGSLAFGFEDPSYTGELLGLLGIFYPLYGKNISIYPDFTKPLLEGEIFLQGRIYLAVMLKIAWVLYRDKNIKNVIRKFKS